MTCSLIREENQEQIQRFLAEYPNFRLMAEDLLIPDENGNDGFYFAELQKV